MVQAKKSLNFDCIRADFNEPWNILERHKRAEIVAQDVAKKLIKEAVTKSREKEIQAETEAAMYMAFARVLMTRWRDLAKKETRLKTMFEAVEKLLTDGLTEPDRTQLEVEAEFEKQTKTKVSRLKVDPGELTKNRGKK